LRLRVPLLPASAPAAGARAPPAKRAREGAPPDDGRVVRASHILVKHRDSRRASSWKEPVVTRSKEEAVELLHVFQARLEAGETTFAALAEAESHCSSAKRGGDLGVFGRGKMQRPFEAAAFALEVGATSGVVDTDSGVHLILRTE
jgi:NIMA-interacting peptidyl-prolyl cis-trans isomerase 1